MQNGRRDVAVAAGTCADGLPRQMFGRRLLGTLPQPHLRVGSPTRDRNNGVPVLVSWMTNR